jgi:hypothetical protein
MSTPISNVSVSQELQSFPQIRRAPAQPAPDKSINNEAFAVTIQASQGASPTQNAHGFYQQRKADLAQLGDALRNGDAEAAQKAYDALAALGPGGPLKDGQTFHRSDRAAKFAAIGDALAAGDLSAASSSFNRLALTFGHDGSSVGGLIEQGPPTQRPPQATLPPTIIPPSNTTPPGPPQIAPPPATDGGGPAGSPDVRSLFQQQPVGIAQRGLLSLSV